MVRGGCLTASLPKQEQYSVAAELPHCTGCTGQGAHPPCFPATRNTQLCEAAGWFRAELLLLAWSSWRAPHSCSVVQEAPRSGPAPCPCSVCRQCLPLRGQCFPRRLFACLEEPGSCQAPGAVAHRAASLRRNYCPFTLFSLPVGGFHLCRRMTMESLGPS